MKFTVIFLLFSLFPLLMLAQTSNKLIQRNTKAPIEISGVIIRQDRHNIGYVKLLEQYNAGKPATVYQVFLPNGVQVATAFSFGRGKHDWMVTPLEHPEITYSIDSKAGYDVKDIATILIKNGYL